MNSFSPVDPWTFSSKGSLWPWWSKNRYRSVPRKQVKIIQRKTPRPAALIQPMVYLKANPTKTANLVQIWSNWEKWKKSWPNRKKSRIGTKCSSSARLLEICTPRMSISKSLKISKTSTSIKSNSVKNGKKDRRCKICSHRATKSRKSKKRSRENYKNMNIKATVTNVQKLWKKYAKIIKILKMRQKWK